MIPSAQSWVCDCIPLGVETNGCWGVETQGSISRLAAYLALQCSTSKAIASIYQRLNLTLVCCNAKVLLSPVGDRRLKNNFFPLLLPVV